MTTWCPVLTYKPRGADGPDDVTVTRRQDGQTVESQFLTLVCTVTGVYPSAVVTWTGVKCFSAPNSTSETDDNVCRFRPDQEDDGKVVTCVASNAVFPDHLVRNATYQIELRGQSLCVCLSICLSVSQTDSLSVCLSVCLSLSLSLSVPPPLSLSFSPSLSLSVTDLFESRNCLKL